MEQTSQLVEHILHHALIAVIPDPQHFDAVLAGICDVHIGALLRVEAAAHANVLEVGAALNDIFAHAGGIAQQGGIRVPDAADDLFVIRRNIPVKDDFLSIIMQFFFSGRDEADGLNGNQFFKHGKVPPF